MGPTLLTVYSPASQAFEQPALLSVGLAVLGSSVLAGVLGTLLGNARANAAARRDRYAQTVRCLVAWAEYPYRIRRRTDDEPASLAALANHGHALQEQIAESKAWVAAESQAVSKVFDSCLRELSARVAPACVAAWQAPPVTAAAGMVLGDIGLQGVHHIVARMEVAVSYRFGPRRLMGRRWTLRRLRWRGCLPGSEIAHPDSRLREKPVTRPAQDKTGRAASPEVSVSDPDG
ncbi:hypothetical protein [Planobispora rosea]|uniref:hypothetical protein n=1 Tax=Planobispora rosea TaxID=35762 RepID=UPI000839E5ED|nr:hypothetical protein [Planobispora rosea]